MGGTFGKSGSWVVDHKMDNIPLTPYKSDSVGHGSVITGFEDPPPYAACDPLTETPLEKRARKRSHWVAYTTMFVMSIGFSIVLSGVWPYMHSLNSDLEHKSIGVVVAANPFGQLVASPLLGIWGNRTGKIRGACLTTVIFFVFGNAMYSLLALFERMGSMATYYAMIVSRFIVGVSSANVTLCRSYLAQSTTLKERTSGIAIIAAAQALGFVVGPGIQTVLTLVVPDGVDTGIWWLKWDKFTAAGWVAAALGLINLVVLMPCIFTEYRIAENEMILLKQDKSKEESLKLPNPNPLALVGVLFAFFITAFIYVFLETLAVPFATDQYAWSDDKAMVVVGAALMGAGLLATCLFPLSGKLSKMFDERLVMLIPGFLPMMVGTALFLPYPGHDIPMESCPNNVTELPSQWTTLESSVWTSSDDFLEFTSTSESSFDPLPLDKRLPQPDHFSFFRQWAPLSATKEETDPVCTPGCPAYQEWCYSVPQLPVEQLTVAFIIVMMGYPIAQSIAQGLFSKIVGPKPQGLWMGVLTGVGSLARILGPVFVSYIYSEFGTYWCFGSVCVCMILGFIELIIMYPILVPMKVPVPQTKHAYDGPAANP